MLTHSGAAPYLASLVRIRPNSQTTQQPAWSSPLILPSRTPDFCRLSLQYTACSDACNRLHELCCLQQGLCEHQDTTGAGSIALAGQGGLARQAPAGIAASWQRLSQGTFTAQPVIPCAALGTPSAASFPPACMRIHTPCPCSLLVAHRGTPALHKAPSYPGRVTPAELQQLHF